MAKEIITYRDIQIEIFNSPFDKHTHVLSLIFNNNISSYNSREEAIEQAKKKIDAFLDQKITSFKELTEALNKAIYLDSYTEDTFLDENVVKILVTKFINEHDT